MASETYTMTINGTEHILTQDDSIQCLRRDYAELCQAFNPDFIHIKRHKPPPGSGALLEITVDLRKYRSGGLYYLDSVGFTTPKETNHLSFFIDVIYGYPATKPKVYFPATRRNVHVNVFSPEGKDLNTEKSFHCHGDWGPDSSLFTIARKVILSIIHDESVAGYRSPACFIQEQIQWQKDMARKGKFPAIDPALLYRKSDIGCPSLPAQSKRVPPTLPGN